MVKGKAAPLAAALVLAAACCQYAGGAAGSAALALAARGSAAGRVGGALLAAAALTSGYTWQDCGIGTYLPTDKHTCWNIIASWGDHTHGGCGYDYEGDYGYGRGCYVNTHHPTCAYLCRNRI